MYIPLAYLRIYLVAVLEVSAIVGDCYGLSRKGDCHGGLCDNIGRGGRRLARGWGGAGR